MLESSAMAALHLFAVLVCAWASLAEKKQAFVIRHCVRATSEDEKMVPYSAVPLPKWGVPVDWCTEKGASIVVQTGEALVKDWGANVAHVRMFADNVMRDGLTATSLLEGMGIQQSPVVYDVNLFSTTDPHFGHAICDRPDASIATAERKQRFEDVPLPWDFDQAVREMESIVGAGSGGKISDLGGLKVDEEGRPTGSAKLMQLFGQLMFYAHASDIPFANATDEQINKFVAWHHWYRAVEDFTTDTVVKNTHILRAVLESLEDNHAGTDVFVGHDTNIDGVAHALDLVWEAPPYRGGRLNPTPPGSGLWFERNLKSDKISVSYLYRAFNSTDDFHLSASPIRSWENREALRGFLFERLGKFEGALECFHRGRSQSVADVVV